MKKTKINKNLIDLIICIIGYSVANAVIDFLGITYSTLLSVEFAISILIGTIIILLVQFLLFRLTDLWNKER